MKYKSILIWPYYVIQRLGCVKIKGPLRAFTSYTINNESQHSSGRWAPQPLSWCSIFPVSQCSVLVSNVPVSQCPSFRVSWCPGVLVSELCHSVLVSEFPGVLVSQCPCFQVSLCPGVPVSRYSNVSVREGLKRKRKVVEFSTENLTIFKTPLDLGPP